MSPPSPRERPRRFQKRSLPTASLRGLRGALLVGVVGLARFLIGRSWNQCQSPRTSASSGGVHLKIHHFPLHFQKPDASRLSRMVTDATGRLAGDLLRAIHSPESRARIVWVVFIAAAKWRSASRSRWAVKSGASFPRAVPASSRRHCQSCHSPIASWTRFKALATLLKG